jgi:hypothetical protein
MDFIGNAEPSRPVVNVRNKKQTAPPENSAFYDSEDSYVDP